MTRAPERRATRAAERRSRDDRALLVWGIGYLVIGVVLATVAAWPIYQTPRLIAVAAIGAGLGLGTVLAGRALRWGRLTTALVVLAGYLVVVVPLAIPAALASPPAFLRGIRDGVVGVVAGWKQLLTLTLPVGEYQAVLVPFLIVVLFGSFSAALLIVHERRWSPLAVAIVLALSLFGVAFGSSETSAPAVVLGIAVPAPRELAIGVAGLVASLVWLIGRARLIRARALRVAQAGTVHRRGVSAWLAFRRHALAVALVVVALVGGIAVAPAAADHASRTALRDRVDPIVIVRQQPSPLAAYRGWFAAEMHDAEILSLAGDTARADRLRLATLDSYDGEEFHVGGAQGRFSRLPRSADATPERIVLEVTVGEGYRGIWVPAPADLAAAPDFRGARAEALGDGFHVSEAGASAVTVAAAPGGGYGLLPGDAYRVIAEAPATAGGLEAARGGEPLLDPEEHPALVEWVGSQEIPRTGSGFLQLVERLRARGYLSHAVLDDPRAAPWIAALAEDGGYAFLPSYSGHSRARIEALFQSLIDQERRAGPDASEEMLVAAVGDDEQFATAVALLARYWGLDSRVVLGTRLAGAEAVPGIASCSEVCTGASMSAWAEVRPGAGAWSAVDATPQFRTLPSEIAEGEQMPENPTVPEQVRSESIDPPQVQSESSDAAALPDDADDDALSALWPVLRAVGLAVAALALLALPLLALSAAKTLRRSRRRGAPDPEVRLVGAWEELADEYRDHGVALDLRATRAHAARATGRPCAVELAGLVDRAVFAEHPPETAIADRAWELLDEERRDLARVAGFRQRLAAALTPASFIRRLRPAALTPIGLRRFAQKETVQ